MSHEPTKLALARIAAGWSQTQLIGRMERMAPAVLGRGFHLPDRASLKTYVRRWENGHTVPGPEYRRLLRAVYDRTDEELGFPVGEDGVEDVPPPPPLSTDGLAYFGELFTQHIWADNRLGPRPVVDLVKLQAQQLNNAARDARGPIRHELIRMTSRYYEFLGWLCQDCGRSGSAMAATDRARDLALELGDPLWESYVLMRKSNIATDGDDAATGVALVDAALRSVPAGPRRVHALVMRQKANAHAALGELQDFERAVDTGLTDVGHEATDGDQLAFYCTPSYVAMEAAACWTQLGQPGRALDVFDEVHANWPEDLRRDKGLSLARVAAARAAVGDRDRACSIGREAVGIAAATGSARTVSALRRVRREAGERWRSDPEVQAICAAIASLVSKAS